ncbi:helix-turn-helix domain-containing protein [Pleomorphovibrio marinus]|uniref:helix-turn-helix domain-containing protein n=1 Tax=Pleomorphovibrio marinus TaxID=2164132 RepID=UPI000E09F951|nr:AraC family transcriptional regulator [Pleomorphovibrio marinus]
MNEISIKNMVCPRCILAVQQQLDHQGLAYEKVTLGKVFLEKDISQDALKELEKQLQKLGFSLLKDREVQKIEAVKTALIEIVQLGDLSNDFSLSHFVGNLFGEDYARLSHMFSSSEGVTIEQYLIQLKVEKIKEWLSYGELNVSESAYRLGYSSVQHLSSQFKKVTGMSPSTYKKLSLKPRLSMDEVGLKKPDT